MLVWGAHESGPSSWSGRSNEASSEAGSVASGWMIDARPSAKPIEEADQSVSPSRRRKVRPPSTMRSAAVPSEHEAELERE